MGLGLLCALGLSIPSVLGKESFEQARRGKFTTLSTKYGLMPAGTVWRKSEEGENPEKPPCGCSADRMLN